VIDIHSHILPEVDDGARSWDVAQQMCAMAASDGITHMVATPHANDRYSYDRGAHQASLDRLQELIGSGLQLSLGCDFHLSYENIQDALLNPDRYVVGRSRYLLVELSDYSIPVQMGDWLHRLRSIGLTPIITHPERNPILQKAPLQVLEWVEQECAVQVTASAFTGFWGRTAKRAAEWLLERDAVHFLATDAHDLKHRVPNLSEARKLLAKTYDDELARILTDDNPGAVVRGEDLPYFPRL
jgi:protein-tyrosine phosphatase